MAFLFFPSCRLDVFLKRSQEGGQAVCARARDEAERGTVCNTALAQDRL